MSMLQGVSPGTIGTQIKNSLLWERVGREAERAAYETRYATGLYYMYLFYINLEKLNRT